jgi:hypothetical protein
MPPWSPLPHGIDNSLGQRFIGPLVAFAKGVGMPVDVDALISQSLERGEFGALVVIDGWNGAPDDEQVLATFAGSRGLHKERPTDPSPVPRWNGEDVWEPRSPTDHYPHMSGYVSGGTLVVDARSLGEEDSTLSIGSAQDFVLQSQLVVRTARITPESLRLVTYGRVKFTDLLAQVPLLVKFLAGGQTCDSPDGTPGRILCLNMPNLLRGAADLPATEAPTPGRLCAAISVAAVADAFPAKMTQ